MALQTPTQYAILALVLLAGWLFGLASHPGGRKWKQRYHDERDGAVTYRRDADEKLTAANARIKELEAELARERSQRHAVPGTAAVAATGAGAAIGGAAPVASSHAVPAGHAGNAGHLGDHGHSDGDDLTRIRGISPEQAMVLRRGGVRHFADVEHLSADAERDIEQDLRLAPGTVAREGWREQAAMLRQGHHDEHRRRWFS